MRFARFVVAPQQKLCAGVLLALSLGPVSAVQAQNYPTKPITLVMPYPPGGGTDAMARLIAQRLEKRLRQPIVFEYRPGAGSAIAAAYVARQPADGTTILYATSTTMAINVSVHKNLSYDPVKDFVPIALFAITPFVLVVNTSLPISSVTELAAYAKSKPGALSYASNGPGGASHLFAELTKSMLGIEMTHVPYKGNAPALNDVVAGHVSLMFVDPSASVQLVREGKLRALGVTTAKRLSTVPDLPPLAEVGLPCYDASSWHMFVAPAGTPKPVAQRLYAEIDAIVKQPDAMAEIGKRGFEPSAGGPPDELALFVQSEIERWGKVVRSAGAAGIE